MGGQVNTTDLDRYDVSRDHGFLTDEPPLRAFDEDVGQFCRRLDELASALPSLLAADELRPAVDSLEAPTASSLASLTTRETRRVYTVCGFLANAYVHQIGAPSVSTIPAGLAVPLYESATSLGRTPVLSYDSYVLQNWHRFDPDGGMDPHNLGSNVNFVDLRDETWFIAIHAAIESAAGPALAAIGRAQQAIHESDDTEVLRALRTIEEALHRLVPLLDRMGEHNHPEQYGEGFRPYLDALTDVEFAGVDALDGPQRFRGASGAQSSLFPALDAAIGVDHGDNPLVNHLETLRTDMPPAHRAFIQAAGDGPDIRAYAEAGDTRLREAFNECIDRMVDFRELHTDVVRTYLAGAIGETEGTGGTPYGRFLQMFVDDTRSCRLPG